MHFFNDDIYSQKPLSLKIFFNSQRTYVDSINERTLLKDLTRTIAAKSEMNKKAIPT